MKDVVTPVWQGELLIYRPEKSLSQALQSQGPMPGLLWVRHPNELGAIFPDIAQACCLIGDHRDDFDCHSSTWGHALDKKALTLPEQCLRR